MGRQAPCSPLDRPRARPTGHLEESTFNRRRGEPVGWATRRVVHALEGGGRLSPSLRDRPHVQAPGGPAGGGRGGCEVPVTPHNRLTDERMEPILGNQGIHFASRDDLAGHAHTMCVACACFARENGAAGRTAGTSRPAARWLTEATIDQEDGSLTQSTNWPPGRGTDETRLQCGPAWLAPQSENPAGLPSSGFSGSSRCVCGAVSRAKPAGRWAILARSGEPRATSCPRPLPPLHVDALASGQPFPARGSAGAAGRAGTPETGP